MTELILLIFGTRNYCVQFLSCRKSSIKLAWGEGLIETEDGQRPLDEKTDLLMFAKGVNMW